MLTSLLGDRLQEVNKFRRFLTILYIRRQNFPDKSDIVTAQKGNTVMSSQSLIMRIVRGALQFAFLLSLVIGAGAQQQSRNKDAGLPWAYGFATPVPAPAPAPA